MPAAEDTIARDIELPNLPVEILHRILTHGPAESALALCQVNRKLHSVCYDPRVFLHLIHHRIVHDSFRSKHVTEGLGLDHETDAGVVAKWALAVSRLDDGREDITTDVLRWAPHLQIAGGGSSVLSDMIVHFPFHLKYLDVDIIAKASFSWTCAYLDYRCDRDAMSHLASMAGEAARCVGALGPLVGSKANDGIHAFFDAKLPFSSETTDDPTWWRVHIHANIAVAILSRIVRASLNLKRIVRLAPGLPTNVLPPKTTQIPLASLIDLQPPFTPLPSHGMFNTAHLGKTTRPEFIENEPWIGYYCYSMATSVVDVDTMMSDVTIKCIAQDAVNTELEGQGADGCGRFEIRGVLHRATGLMTLTKQYRQGTRWRWDAVMTPFGIVGTWGRNHWGGWFWLWKKSWSSTSQV